MLYFGSQQLSNALPWTGYLPTWTQSLPISQMNFVYLNGWFEIIAGILLFTGFYTRIIAGLLALHLIGITISVGYDATGVRDFGLSIALISLFLQGESIWSLDKYFNAREIA